jgi:hypothetical protein
MVAGKVTGRQAVWQAVRRRKRFTLDDIWHDTKHERATVWSYLKALRAGGYIADDGKAPPRTQTLSLKRPQEKHRLMTFKLIKDVGIEAPKLKPDGTPSVQGLPREQMWRTMKLVGDFTFRELAIAARTEIVNVSEEDARAYVKHLKAAGYLMVTKEATPRSLAVYRFVRSKNTGPRAPMIQRLKTVFDPNLCKVMWQEEPNE